MPLAVNDAMEALSVIAREENMKVTVQQSLRGGAMAGGGAIVGGFVAGPVGMAIGGTLGAVLGAATGQDFKPLAAIIMELPTHTKQELTDRMNNIVSGFDPADIVTFLALIRGSAALRLQLINGVKSYLEQQQGINVTC
ncbi:unnamed protein product [Clavelina lepadiformis]|uniref:Uncharacterized protein n=1 Tax=Clavelina lepadiformis TaxID=159417 RepID=A0ABP0GYW2_CLALP